MSELAKAIRGETITLLPRVDEPDEPVVGRITHGAFSNLLFQVVLDRFGKTAFARSSACMEFESFLRSIFFITAGAASATCLEIGTYQGSSAIILSQFFKRVICVSVDDDLRRIIKRDIIEYLGIKNIEFYDAHNNKEKKQIIDSMEFDFAYLDGDHIHDTHEDFALVKRCGRVLFHEYWPLQAVVWNLVNSLPPSEVKRAQVDCFAYWERKGG